MLEGYEFVESCVGRVHMGRLNPGVPVIPAELSVIPAPTRDRYTRACRGYLAAFSATVCAKLDEIVPISSAEQATTSAAMTEF